MTCLVPWLRVTDQKEWSNPGHYYGSNEKRQDEMPDLSLSIKELVARYGVCMSTASNWKTGKTKPALYRQKDMPRIKAEILKLFMGGMKRSAIVSLLGCSSAHVYEVCYGLTKAGNVL